MDWHFFIWKNIIRKEGFALPSVLFLVTILSLVILSILTLKYLNRQSALLDVARVKADYAAINGINQALADLNSVELPGYGEKISREYMYAENESASIQIQRWGIFSVAFSMGRKGKISSERVAIIASHLTRQFDNALVFANSHHQLVLTGTAKIQGNVVTGQNGVTTGTLRNLPTPRTVPIEGNIKKEASPTFSLAKWKNVVEEMSMVFDGNLPKNIQSDEIIHLKSNTSIQIDSSVIAEKIKCIFVDGNIRFKGNIVRRMLPLSIIVRGSVEFQQDASVLGLVAVFSKRQIIVPSNASIESVILFSQDSIKVEPNARFSAQLFAPSIDIAPSTVLLYPSVLVSFPTKTREKNERQVQLAGGSRIEGTVAMLSGSANEYNSRIIIQTGAKVVGTVISENSLTLDGSVDGSVVTKNFYFYEDPTTYLGWIRTGQINRSALSPVFLMPPGFSESDRLDVMDWL